MTPPIHCAVRTCNNKKTGNATKLRFFPFPDGDAAKFRLWETASDAGRLDKTNKLYLCENHFEDNAYRMQDVLMNVPRNKRKLSDTAVPTLLVPVNLESGGDVPQAQIVEVVPESGPKRPASVSRDMLSKKLQEAKNATSRPPSGNVPPTQPADQQVVRLKRMIDDLAWKVCDQQAEIFRLNREIKRFKQFFSTEEAQSIQAGDNEMMMKAEVMVDSDESGVKEEALRDSSGEEEDTDEDMEEDPDDDDEEYEPDEDINDDNEPDEDVQQDDEEMPPESSNNSSPTPSTSKAEE